MNVAQCFREPATYFLFTKDSAMLAASYNVQSLVRRAFGQVPGGMFGADENARIGFFDPRQGTETCGFCGADGFRRDHAFDQWRSLLG